MNGILMASKYRGGCCICQEKFQIGDPIVYYGKERGKYCFACWPAEDRPADWRSFDDAGYLFYDLETSGINPHEGVDDRGNQGPCAPVQIAAIATTKNLVIQDTFNIFIRPNPNLHYDPEAMKVHGRSVESLMNEPDEAEALDAFVSFCERYPNYRVAGFNVKFDENFMDVAKKRHGITTALYKTPPLCIYEIAVVELFPVGMKEKYGGTKLVHVSEHHGFKVKGAHNALVDIYQTILNARRFIPIAA